MNQEPKIILNSIRTPDGTVLISRHRHDFQSYLDKVTGETYIVDGGLDYLRRSVNSVPATDLSVFSNDPFYKIRKNLYWGVRENQKVVYKPISSLDTEHLYNILKIDTILPIIKENISKELNFRDQKKILSDRVFILGNSGHDREMVQFLNCNNNFESIYNTTFVTLDKDFLKNNNPEDDISLFLGIGCPKIKRKLVEGPYKYYYFNTLYDEGVYCPPRLGQGKINIGEGCYIAPEATLTCNIKLGQHVHINTSATVCHDVEIGRYTFVGPGSVVCGNVFVGEDCYIGAGVTIKDQVSIVDNVIVGAGSLVLYDITEPGTYVGNPVRKIN